MKQLSIEEHCIVPLDYDSLEFSPAVRQFRPTLYRDAESFCCILGPDHEHAIEGCGSTEDEALKMWEKAFKERLKSTGEDDELVQFIRDTLATSKEDVW